MPPTSEEERLVEAAQLGDRGAFGELYVRFSRMVHGILLARLPPDEVEDVVQEVFMSALRNLARLERPGAFPAWLATIARHRACDRHRRGRRHDPLPDDLPGGRHPEDRGHTVLAAIRTLPEAYREPLILRLVEGMTGPEIAERTGLSHGSVRVNLHRGMEQLRARLSGGEPHEG